MVFSHQLRQATLLFLEASPLPRVLISIHLASIGSFSQTA